MRTYELSKNGYDRSKRYLAGGVASSLRAAMKPVPLFAESAQGAVVRDVDGNAYIDYLLGYGPLILGHAYGPVNEKVYAAMQRGITYGLQHQGEIELAKLLTEVLPCADKVALSGSGTEAVMLALRLARAYTGRSKIIRFHGHYHGWSDSIYTSFPSADMPSASASATASGAVPPGTAGQSELSLRDVVLLPWNDQAALEAALAEHEGEIAAVISEPVMCNSGCIVPRPGYLEFMREATAKRGIVLILDEVITGFRLGLGGAHGRFGIKPDLVTVGKAMGGGFAVSGVAGRAELMALIDDGTVSHLGTLNGNCVATAAALATIGELAKDDGAAYDKMEKNASKLTAGLRTLLGKHGIRGVINEIGPVFHFIFTEQTVVEDFASFNLRDSAKYALFAERMLEAGVLVRPNGLWYVSAAHEDADIDATLEAADRVLGGLR
ncbi:aspartate aminotransferase family protein [Cohnella rhizosphaerae]|uniref:Aspartate aminotransferase family protein n=1 Tax=Cohnella rhizosphaerae TaxID=1457232 RepID=A0A9X4L435_9BACL|nr:aspartate aminotransferase family protein [Cohnella rhizosphaerae]MDG0813399.1 aspartate aminotransferase family protein [Cohnella rhizosphaerae]